MSASSIHLRLCFQIEKEDLELLIKFSSLKMPTYLLSKLPFTFLRPPENEEAAVSETSRDAQNKRREREKTKLPKDRTSKAG